MRAPLVVSAAISVCFGFLAVSQLAGQAPQAPNAPHQGTVLVDMSAIMKNSARFNQAMEGLKKEYEAKAEKMKQRSEQGSQIAAELRTLAPSDPRRKQLEQQMLQMRADHELEGKKVTNDIRDAESKIILGLMGELKGELEQYARSKQVKLILRNDPTPPDLTDPRMILQEIHKPIVYQSGSDVTPSILEMLNRGAAPATGNPTTGRAPGPARPVR
jgi:Skp family chaperone for outer membrane proteins